jgi:hypothetical protein
MGQPGRPPFPGLFIDIERKEVARMEKTPYSEPEVTRLGPVEEHTATIVDASRDAFGHGRVV